MVDNRCPLCMEKLKGGECSSCGYRLPDEENLSSIYDAEPAEYPEPEPIREITPEIQMEEIYPNRQEMPKFKVRDDEGKTVRSRIDLASIDEKKNSNGNPYAIPYPTNSNHNTTGGNSNATSGNPYASNGNPYAGYTPEGVPNQSGGSPFANQSVYSNSGADTESVQGFLKKYWWLVLLSFFIPIVGIILNSTMKNELKAYKASYLVIIAIVLGFIIPP